MQWHLCRYLTVFMEMLIYEKNVHINVKITINCFKMKKKCVAIFVFNGSMSKLSNSSFAKCSMKYEKRKCLNNYSLRLGYRQCVLPTPFMHRVICNYSFVWKGYIISVTVFSGAHNNVVYSMIRIKHKKYSTVNTYAGENKLDLLVDFDSTRRYSVIFSPRARSHNK